MLWKGIQSLVSLKRKTQMNVITLLYKNKELRKNEDVAEDFSEYRANIGVNLSRNISHVKHSYQHYLKTPYNDSFLLEPTTPNEILKIIKNFKNEKSLGLNGVPLSILKFNSDIFSQIISKLINISFTKGVFQDISKVAKVVPIFKKGDLTMCSNFLVGAVFVDLQKAFDTVGHKILLSKLVYYGIRDNSFSWLSSYLTERKQSVYVNGYSSTYELAQCGVPQGSSLGPLLFTLYINDLKCALNLTTSYLFADDTCLLIKQKTHEKLKISLNLEPEYLYDWLCANKLSLNKKKTELTTFRSKSYKLFSEDFHILLNSYKITPGCL